MRDNPGVPKVLRQAEVRDFRELTIEIGEVLRARSGANPGIASWLLAFNNWNASGV